MDHPADEVLFRFINLQATRAENREVVCHLLRRCPDCAAKIRAAELPWVNPEDHEEALKRVFDKFLNPPRRKSWASLLPFDRPGFTHRSGKP